MLSYEEIDQVPGFPTKRDMLGMKFYYVKCEILKRYAEFIMMFESNS